MVEKVPKRPFFRSPQGLLVVAIVLALLCASLFIVPGLWWALFGGE